MARLHPNVHKFRKQTRMRRAYLKPFSAGLVKVPRSVGKADVPEPMEALFDYRGRGGTYWDNTLDRIFGFHKAQPLMLSKERLAVIKRLQEMTSQVNPECNVVVHRGGITKTITRFYFASDYSLCFFIKEDWLGMYMDKSETYYKSRIDLRTPRDRAYDDYNNKRLKWVERVYFPTIEPDPPSG